MGFFSETLLPTTGFLFAMPQGAAEYTIEVLIDAKPLAQYRFLQEQFQRLGMGNEQAHAMWDHSLNFYRYADHLPDNCSI
jgi:hypothetical protein